MAILQQQRAHLLVTNPTYTASTNFIVSEIQRYGRDWQQLDHLSALE